MKSVIRRLVRILVIVAVVLIAVVVAGSIVLQPPGLEVPSQGLVLSDVTVVNPGLDRRNQQMLVVQGAKIERISDSNTSDPAAEHTRRFAGAYVLPGLIDMHVHYASYPDRDLFGLLFLAHGVTTVRDTGNFDGSIWETRQAILEGKYPGPRIFACGPILDGDPPIWPGSRVVRTSEEAQTAVAEVAAQGANCVKAYSRLSSQALAAIHKAAVQHGLPVIGHVPLAVPFTEAHLADVQHLTGVPPLPQPPPSTFAAWLVAAWQEFDSTDIDAIVQSSAEQQIAHTPTLVVFAHHSQLLDPQQVNDPAARLLPRYYREVLWSTKEGFPYIRNPSAESLTALAIEFTKMKQFVRRLHEAGVHVHVGSDTPNPFVAPGISLHEELRHLVDAGLTPEQVWVAATRQAGEWLREPRLGTLQEGAPADFLIFREDPTRDLAALSTLEAVVTNGRLYPKEMLDEILARWRAHFEGRFYDAVSMAVVRRRMKSGFASE